MYYNKMIQYNSLDPIARIYCSVPLLRFSGRTPLLMMLIFVTTKVGGKQIYYACFWDVLQFN